VTAPWLAVTGAKGGVGKTLVAVNMALLFARAGHRTLLVDLDPGCGNVDVHLRLCRRTALDDVVLQGADVRGAVLTGPFGLRVLAGRSGSAALCGDDAALHARTHAAIERAAADSDLVVCDTGAGLGPATLAAAARADLVASLVTLDPSALTDAYAQCKLLHQRGRPLPRLLVNGVASRDEALRTAGRFAAVCRRFLGRECTLLGWLHRDPALLRSALEQRPLAVHGGGAPLAELGALCAQALAALPPLPLRAPRPAATIATRLSAV